MLGTGPLGALGAGGGGDAVAGGAEAVCGGGDAVPRDAGCRGCERGVLAVVGFGGVAATSSGVALPAVSRFALAVRGALPVGRAVAAAAWGGVAADSICWACCSVDGVGVRTAAVLRALGGWRVNGRRPDGLAPPAFSARSRPGNVCAGPRASMTFSFTTTSGPVGPPITMVCAATGKTGTASSVPVRSAARQPVSRREADAEYLPIPNPNSPRKAIAPCPPALRSKYRAWGHAATARFCAVFQGLSAPFMASLRSAASGRCR